MSWLSLAETNMSSGATWLVSAGRSCRTGRYEEIHSGIEERGRMSEKAKGPKKEDPQPDRGRDDEHRPPVKVPPRTPSGLG